MMLCYVCKRNKSRHNPYNFSIREQIWVKPLNMLYLYPEVVNLKKTIIFVNNTIET